MRQILKSAFVWGFLFLTTLVFSQNYPVDVKTTMTSPYSLYLSEYANPTTDRIQVNLLLKDAVASNVGVRLRLHIKSADGLDVITKPGQELGPFFLDGGVPLSLSGFELASLFESNSFNVTGPPAIAYRRARIIPEGFYTFHFEVIDNNVNKLLSNTFIGSQNVFLTLSDPPLLNLPVERVEPLTPQNINFTWTPRHLASPNASKNVEYEFEMIEVFPVDQDINNAFFTTSPIFVTNTRFTSLNYGIAEPYLQPGKRYAYRVRVADNGGLDLFKNRGYSEVKYFDYDYSCRLPDYLEFTPIDENTVKIEWEDVPLAESYLLRVVTPASDGAETTEPSYNDKTSSQIKGVNDAKTAFYRSSPYLQNLLKKTESYHFYDKVKPGSQYTVNITTLCQGETTNSSRSYVYRSEALEPSEPCMPPRNYQLTPLENNRLKIAWDEISGTISEPRMWYTLNGSTSKQFVDVVNPASVTLDGIPEGTELTFNLVFNCGGEQVITDPQSTTVTSNPQHVGTCVLPSYLGFVVERKGRSYEMRWKGGSYEKYLLEYRPVGSLSWVKHTTVDPNKTTEYLTEDLEYEYRITYFCSEESTVETETYRFTINSKTGIGGGNTITTNQFTSDPILTGTCFPPAKVVHVGENSGKDVRISWEAQDKAEGYEIALRENSTGEWTDVNVTEIEYLLNDLPFNETYEYKIRTTCADGPSNYTQLYEINTGDLYNYTGECGSVTSLTAEGASTTGIKLSWEGQDYHTGFKVNYRVKKGTVEEQEEVLETTAIYLSKGDWYESLTEQEEYLVEVGFPSTTIEYSVTGLCGANDGDPSDIGVARSLTKKEDFEKEVEFACGQVPASWDLDNKTPLEVLQVGDTVLAADFQIIITEVSESAPYTGQAKMVVPYMDYIRVFVDLKELEVNTDYRMYGGKLNVTKTIVSYLKEDQLAKLDEFSDKILDIAKDVEQWSEFTSLALEMGEDFFSGDKEKEWEEKYKDYDANEKLDAITSLTKEASDLAQTGNPTDKILATEKMAEVAWLAQQITQEEVKGLDAKGDYQVEFLKADQTTENQPFVDSYNGKLKGYYEELETRGGNFMYFVPYVSIHKGETRKVKVKVTIPDFDPEKLSFTSASASAQELSLGNQGNITKTIEANGDIFIEVPSGANRIFAVYEAEGGGKDRIGKLNVVETETITKEIVIVPNKASSISAQTYKEELEKIYAGGDVKFTISLADPYVNPEHNSGLVVEDHTRMSRYSQQMQAIEDDYFKTTSRDNSKYYLFQVASMIHEEAPDEPEEGEEAHDHDYPKNHTVKGYMPRGKKVGFLTDLSLQNLAHEIGHGMFKLKHTWIEDREATEADTDNLMDYKQGTELLGLQWHKVQNPDFAPGWGDDAGDGELSVIAYNKTLKKFCVKDQEKECYLHGNETPYITFLSPAGKPITIRLFQSLKLALSDESDGFKFDDFPSGSLLGWSTNVYGIKDIFQQRNGLGQGEFTYYSSDYTEKYIDGYTKSKHKYDKNVVITSLAIHNNQIVIKLSAHEIDDDEFWNPVDETFTGQDGTNYKGTTASGEILSDDDFEDVYDSFRSEKMTDYIKIEGVNYNSEVKDYLSIHGGTDNNHVVLKHQEICEYIYSHPNVFSRSSTCIGRPYSHTEFQLALFGTSSTISEGQSENKRFQIPSASAKIPWLTKSYIHYLNEYLILLKNYKEKNTVDQWYSKFKTVLKEQKETPRNNNFISDFSNALYYEVENARCLDVSYETALKKLSVEERIETLKILVADGVGDSWVETFANKELLIINLMRHIKPSQLVNFVPRLETTLSYDEEFNFNDQGGTRRNRLLYDIVSGIDGANYNKLIKVFLSFYRDTPYGKKKYNEHVSSTDLKTLYWEESKYNDKKEPCDTYVNSSLFGSSATPIVGWFGVFKNNGVKLNYTTGKVEIQTEVVEKVNYVTSYWCRDGLSCTKPEVIYNEQDIRFYSPFDLISLELYSDDKNFVSMVKDGQSNSEIGQGKKLVPAIVLHYIALEKTVGQVQDLAELTLDVASVVSPIATIAAVKKISEIRKVVIALELISASSNVVVNVTDLDNHPVYGDYIKTWQDIEMFLTLGELGKNFLKKKLFTNAIDPNIPDVFSSSSKIDEQTMKSAINDMESIDKSKFTPSQLQEFELIEERIKTTKKMWKSIYKNNYFKDLNVSPNYPYQRAFEWLTETTNSKFVYGAKNDFVFEGTKIGHFDEDAVLYLDNIGDIDKNSEILSVADNIKYKSNGIDVTGDVVLIKNTNGDVICVKNACFTANTPVQNTNGTVVISEVKKGDFVWAYDEENKSKVLSKVQTVFSKEVEQLKELIIDKDTIYATGNHPFLTSVGWVMAENLKIGSYVISSENEQLEVLNNVSIDTSVTVYNFEVKKYHTYCVGKNSLVVHNDCEATKNLLDKGYPKNKIDDLIVNGDIDKMSALIDKSADLPNLKQFLRTNIKSSTIKNIHAYANSSSDLALLNKVISNPDIGSKILSDPNAIFAIVGLERKGVSSIAWVKELSEISGLQSKLAGDNFGKLLDNGLNDVLNDVIYQAKDLDVWTAKSIRDEFLRSLTTLSDSKTSKGLNRLDELSTNLKTYGTLSTELSEKGIMNAYVKILTLEGEYSDLFKKGKYILRENDAVKSMFEGSDYFNDLAKKGDEFNSSISQSLLDQTANAQKQKIFDEIGVSASDYEIQQDLILKLGKTEDGFNAIVPFDFALVKKNADGTLDYDNVILLDSKYSEGSNYLASQQTVFDDLSSGKTYSILSKDGVAINLGGSMKPTSAFTVMGDGNGSYSKVIKNGGDLVKSVGKSLTEMRSSVDEWIGLQRSLANSNNQLRQFNTATVVHNKSTGKFYYGANKGIAKSGSDIHETLARNLPETSTNSYKLGNCSECDAVNQALHDGGNWGDLQMHTVGIQWNSGNTFSKPLCSNCDITFKGIEIIE